MQLNTTLIYPAHNGLKVVALAFLASCFWTQSALACACCDTYRVHGVEKSDTLNVRSGPGVDFKVVAKLRSDEGCITRNGERRGNWVYINANESGAAGWVNRRFLKFFSS